MSELSDIALNDELERLNKIRRVGCLGSESFASYLAHRELKAAREKIAELEKANHKPMIDIYLAGPYSGTPEREAINYRHHMSAYAMMLKAGIAAYSPIVASHPTAKEFGLGGDWKTWAEIDKRFIACSERVWVLTVRGWKQSVGVCAEIEYAESLGKEIFYGNIEAVEAKYGKAWRR